MGPHTTTRLDGWKAIAEYLDRDSRTLQRWRNERGLPIYRVPGARGGTVFAYPHELDSWLREAPLARNGAVVAGDQTADANTDAAMPGETMAQGARLARIPAAWRASTRYLAVGSALLGALITVGTARFVRSSPPAVPSAMEGAEVRGENLVALDADKRTVWTFKVPPQSGRLSNDEPPYLRAAFPLDLNADGQRELIALIGGQKTPELAETYALSASGTLLWRFMPDFSFKFDTNLFQGPWRIWTWLVPPAGELLWMSFIHQTWWPSFVVALDRTGQSTLRFVNTGYIDALGRLPTDGGVFVLAGGSNNEYDAASLAVLAEQGGPATSPHESSLWRMCDRCPRDGPSRYFLFPRSELNVEARNERNFVHSFSRYDDGSFEVTVRERTDPPLRAVYRFFPDLQPEWVAMSDSYWEMHRQLSQAGELNHSAEQCPIRRDGVTVRAWDAETGWRDVVVPYGFQTTPKGT